MIRVLTSNMKIIDSFLAVITQSRIMYSAIIKKSIFDRIFFSGLFNPAWVERTQNQFDFQFRFGIFFQNKIFFTSSIDMTYTHIATASWTEENNTWSRIRLVLIEKDKLHSLLYVACVCSLSRPLPSILLSPPPLKKSLLVKRK